MINFRRVGLVLRKNPNCLILIGILLIYTVCGVNGIGARSSKRVKRTTGIEYGNSTSLDCDFKCPSDNSCLQFSKICDNYVHCPKGEDELDCSCKERISSKKLCDGIPDCPDGEDEGIGCGECSEDQFSCGPELGIIESKIQCIGLNKVCNGIKDCSTGIDEQNCFRLENFDHAERGLLPKGFLQKRIGSEWYTLCKGTKSEYLVGRYVKLACEGIVGPIGLTDSPTISKMPWPKKSSDLPSHLKSTKFSLIGEAESKFSVINGTGGCPSKNVITAICPEPQCGWPASSTIHSNAHAKPHYRKRRDMSTGDAHETEVHFGPLPYGSYDDERNSLTAKVVGGYDSKLGDWPFLVGIFRNGSFHCGGSLINDRWVLTAAHCFHSQQKYVYEIQAGMTRRFSWSPYEQTRQVVGIYSHERYDHSIFRNDIALVHVESPGFRLSRWVGPGCIAPGDGSKDPSPKEECTVVGWGNLAETIHGPDHMQEVNLPTLESCKEIFTKNDEQICAGVTEGGKDACQGDSGGPFVCKDSDGRSIISGLVSFGKGCARKETPGIYTRVSHYRSWIESVVSGENRHVKTQAQPLKCTYDKCLKTGGECLFPKFRCNRKVDCFDGSDEMNCDYPPLSTDGGSSGSNSHSEPMLQRAYSDVELAEHGGREHSHDFFDQFKLCGPTEFQCKTTKTCIPINLICNAVLDCSDGTDEMGCDCGTLISNGFPSKSCNGWWDCVDGSDEVGCSSNNLKIICPISKSSVSNMAWCDGKKDCLPHGEDEADCIRLAKKPNKVGILSSGFLSDKYLRGLNSGWVYVRKGSGGEWVSLCAEEMKENGAEDICTYLGFESDPEEISVQEPSPGTPSTTCSPVKITCGQPLCGQRKLYAFSPASEQPLDSSSLEPGMWPWLMKVLIDGKILCSGTLVHKDWFLVPKSCLEIDGKLRSLSISYVTVMSGYSNQSTIISSPLEQIRRVNGIELIPKNDHFVLLHLQNSVSIDHFTSPICTTTGSGTSTKETIEKTDFRKVSCAGVGLDTSQKVEVRWNGLTNQLYVLGNCQDSYNDTWIYCQLKNDHGKRQPQWSYIGWIGYNDEATDLECPGKRKITIINPFLNDEDHESSISEILSKNLPSSILHPPPPCSGGGGSTRCSLGNCIEKKYVCDRISHCGDGADEKHCQRHYLGFKSSGHDEEISHAALAPAQGSTPCPTGHFPCSTTSNCLPIDSYCDGVPDCGPDDDTDEAECSCRNYLALSAPTRLCDGKIDCPDREDEIIGCKCDNNYTSFSCGGNQNNCIAPSLICDGHKDCPNGKDEEDCISLSQNLESVLTVGATKVIGLKPEGYVLVRIKGVWHPYCSNEWSSELGSRICGVIGASSSKSKLQTFDLYEFNTRKNEIKRKGNLVVDPDDKIQLIQLGTTEDLERLHSVYSNVIELEENEPEDEDLYDENDKEDKTPHCKIGYLTCM